MVMNKLALAAAVGAAAVALSRWYTHEHVVEGRANVAWQSEHAHLHLHVDLPSDMEVQAGDTMELLEQPPEPYTDGEVEYASDVRLYKASWLRRQVIERTSLIEVKEIVEHP